ENIMSYIRGKYYIWGDGERLHLWATDGFDHWNASVWHEGWNKFGKRRKMSGVSIPDKVLDQYVVMRFAEIACQGLLELTMNRALRHEGNGGCMALAKNHKIFQEIFVKAKLENPFPWLDFLDVTKAQKGMISPDIAAELRRLCADQGLNWDSMTKSERKAFINNHARSHPFARQAELKRKLKQRAKRMKKT
ncbi:hypothetical protein L0156_15905, partial [bacterium]|nr:hypothetical protein [bacterium]